MQKTTFFISIFAVPTWPKAANISFKKSEKKKTNRRTSCKPVFVFFLWVFCCPFSSDSPAKSSRRAWLMQEYPVLYFFLQSPPACSRTGVTGCVPGLATDILTIVCVIYYSSWFQTWSFLEWSWNYTQSKSFRLLLTLIEIADSC